MNNVTAVSLPEGLTITNETFNLDVITNGSCTIHDITFEFYDKGSYLYNRTVFGIKNNDLKEGANTITGCHFDSKYDFPAVKADEVVIIINTGTYDTPIYFKTNRFKMNVDIPESKFEKTSSTTGSSSSSSSSSQPSASDGLSSSTVSTTINSDGSVTYNGYFISGGYKWTYSNYRIYKDGTTSGSATISKV